MDRWWWNAGVVALMGAVSLLFVRDAFTWGWVCAALVVLFFDAVDQHNDKLNDTNQEASAGE